MSECRNHNRKDGTGRSKTSHPDSTGRTEPRDLLPDTEYTRCGTRVHQGKVRYRGVPGVRWYTRGVLPGVYTRGVPPGVSQLLPVSVTQLLPVPVTQLLPVVTPSCCPTLHPAVARLPVTQLLPSGCQKGVSGCQKGASGCQKVLKRCRKTLKQALRRP